MIEYLTKVELITPSGFNLTLDTATGNSENKIGLLGADIEDNVNGRISKAVIPLETFDNTFLDQFVRGTEAKIWINEQLDHIFTGYLKDRPKSIGNLSNIYEFAVVDYTARFQEILVNESYKDKTISYIVNDLITRYTSFTVNIEQNDTVLSITFKNKYLFDCLESIANAIGWNFKVDKDKVFNFYSEKSKINPKVIIEDDIVPGTLNINPDESRIVNRLKVRGGYRLSNDYTQTWTVNGSINIFPFHYKRVRASLQGKIVVKIDDVEVNTGTKYMDDFNNPAIDALININDNLIETRNNPVNKVEATYRYEYPIILQLENLESQQKYEIIDGLYEVDSNDESFVKQSGQMYLDKYSQEIITGSFEVFEGVYNAGELIKLDLSEHNINQYLKITSIHYSAGINSLDINIQIENIIDDVVLIKSMLQRIAKLEQQNEDENAIVEKLYSINSNVSVADEIKIYPHQFNFCGEMVCSEVSYI